MNDVLFVMTITFECLHTIKQAFLDNWFMDARVELTLALHPDNTMIEGVTKDCFYPSFSEWAAIAVA